jgi:hypothetical protein
MALTVVRDLAKRLDHAALSIGNRPGVPRAQLRSVLLLRRAIRRATIDVATARCQQCRPPLDLGAVNVSMWEVA